MHGNYFVYFLFVSIVAGIKGEKFTWSSPDAKAQADKTSCKPLQKYENAAMKSILDSTNMQRTSLGAVDNAEVCGGLCCEMENCDLAEFDKLRQCYAVHCSNLKNCDVNSNGDSTVLTFSRKTGSDVWTRSFKKSPSPPSVTNDQPSSPVVSITDKQVESQQQKSPAVESNTNTVAAAVESNANTVAAAVKGTQKSEIPEEAAEKRTEQEGEKSIIDAINEEQLKRIQSLTKELEETDKLDVEASSKSSNENSEKKDKIAADGKEDVKALSAAGEHYLKTDDKDITSFQENDTVTAHSKHPHKRDARHNIMSPITIGAFTCMAVIAVSGFVMAIIKYKREHRDVTNKETQSP